MTTRKTVLKFNSTLIFHSFPVVKKILKKNTDFFFLYFLYNKYSYPYRAQSNQVKPTIYSREDPETDMISMNNFDMEAKEIDITLDENYQENPIDDHVQLLFCTLKELMSHQNRHTSTGNKV